MLGTFSYDCPERDGVWGVARGIIVAMAARVVRFSGRTRPNSLIIRKTSPSRITVEYGTAQF